LRFSQFCELGNLSIHVALRNLRPPGSKVRKIPYPTSNPFTQLFNLVSCPNYTYEVGSWIAFTVMTQSLPGKSIFLVYNISVPAFQLSIFCF
jgi:very-long-chain enoyl-CoA reductase